MSISENHENIDTSVIEELDTHDFVEYTHDGISVESMTTNMVTIVGKAASNLMDWRSRDHGNTRAVYIVGYLGVGKSTILAYLLGHEICKQEQDGGDFAIIYEKTPSVPHPIIGHLGAETKGCTPYLNTVNGIIFCDCAGIEDSQGRDQDMANALCMSLTMSVLPPDTVLVVIRSSEIFEERGKRFLDLIKSLSRCVQCEDIEEAWRGLAFVINDTDTTIIESERVRAQLAHLLETEKDDIQKIIRPYLHAVGAAVGAAVGVAVDAAGGAVRSLAASVRSNLALPTKPVELPVTAGGGSSIDIAQPPTEVRLENDELWKKLPHDKKELVREKETSQKILTWLLRHMDHFVYMDLSDRSKIDDVNRQLRSFQFPRRFFFQPSRLYETEVQQPVEKYSKFINAVAEYIENAYCVVLKAGLMEVESYLCERNRTQLEEEQRRRDVEGDIHTKEAIILTKLTAINTLQSDDSSMFYMSLKPEEPIRARSYFSGPDITAKTYKFSYKSAIPIYAAVEVKGSRDSSFLNIRLSEDERTYSSTFLPAYHGQISDCQASVNLFVRKKDHPDTHKRIELIRTEIATVEALLLCDREKLLPKSNDERVSRKAYVEQQVLIHSESVPFYLMNIQRCMGIIRPVVNILRLQMADRLHHTTSPSLAALQECMETTNFPPLDLKCSRGHPMWALHSIADIAWTCSRCSCCPGDKQLTGMRWVCLRLPCEESICMLCQPPTAIRMTHRSVIVPMKPRAAQHEQERVPSASISPQIDPLDANTAWMPSWTCGHCSGTNTYYFNEGSADRPAATVVCSHCSQDMNVGESRLFIRSKHDRGWEMALVLQEQLDQANSELDKLKWSCCETHREAEGCRRFHPGRYVETRPTKVGVLSGHIWSCCGAIASNAIGCERVHPGAFPREFERLDELRSDLEAALRVQVHHTYPFNESKRRWDCCFDENKSSFGCRIGEQRHHSDKYCRAVVTQMAGYKSRWLCCNNEDRGCVGCSASLHPKLSKPTPPELLETKAP